MLDPTLVARDLKVFADPASNFVVQNNTTTLRVQLIRDGNQRDYTIDLVSGRVRSRHRDELNYVNMPSLLASDEFAAIRVFRATQRRILEAKETGKYIDPEGQLQSTDTTADLTLESFRNTIRYVDRPSLSILLLDGPAGVGKTSLIERMVYERADSAATDPPLLHVMSSGSRLTDLSKALAHATQLLRAAITFDQVPILVRYGVLQVAIDGFDELVDPEGYKDAWSALREFLSEVGHGGPILLSGRDTFFDQQSFQKRLAERIPSLSLTAARLHPTSPGRAKIYLREREWSDEDLKDADAAEWFKPGSYRLRPFFLTQIATSGGWHELVESHGSPQGFLVGRFVRREAEIISRMIALPQEQAEKALWEFYGTIVEDMAAQELDAVDEGYLALACETAFLSHVTSEDLAKLTHKAGSFGLLEAAGMQQHRQFPHSEIQNQFLARAIIANLESSSAIGVFLRRGVVGMALSEAFCDVFAAIKREHASAVVVRLRTLLREELFADRLAANVVTLLIATLTRGDLDGFLAIDSKTTNEARVFGTLGPARLQEVSIGRLDARGSDCRSVEFIGSSVAVLTVDATTRFGQTYPEVSSSLQIDARGTLESMRNPQTIRRWLREHSVQTEDTQTTGSDLPLVKYFERLCREFVRQHQIRDNESDEAFFLLQDPLWNEVQQLLGARLIVETKTARGPRDKYFRMVRPEDLLDPRPDDADSLQIRDKIASRARQLSPVV